MKQPCARATGEFSISAQCDLGRFTLYYLQSEWQLLKKAVQVSVAVLLRYMLYITSIKCYQVRLFTRCTRQSLTVYVPCINIFTRMPGEMHHRWFYLSQFQFCTGMVVFVSQMWRTPFLASATIYTAYPAAVRHHADQHLFSYCNWCRCREHFSVLMQRLYLNTRNASHAQFHSPTLSILNQDSHRMMPAHNVTRSVHRMSLCRSLAEGCNCGFSFSSEMLSITLLLLSVQKITHRMTQGQIFIYCPSLKRHWCSWRRSFTQWHKRRFNWYSESDAVHTDSHLQNYSVTKILSLPVTGNTIQGPFPFSDSDAVDTAGPFLNNSSTDFDSLIVTVVLWTQ